MSKANKHAKTERSEYPKPLVRLQPVVGGWAAEVRTVADGDAETSATGEGFQAVTVPEQAPTYQEYPKMLYHADGRTLTVQNADAEEKAAADGFTDTPGEEAEPASPKSRVDAAATKDAESPKSHGRG